MPKPVRCKEKIVALDCETSGLDLRHGTKPFFVSTCDGDMVNTSWEWDVDPTTRQPIVPPEDLVEIQAVVDEADLIVGQNFKFDLSALQTVFKGKLRFDWSKLRDTLLAGHLLASNQPHDLTAMALIYLGVNVQPYEDRLKKVVTEARKIAKAELPEWKLAKAGLPEMPSAKEGTWKYDCWLPRALVKYYGNRAIDNGVNNEAAEVGGHPCDENHPWLTVLSEYGNSDSLTTLALWRKQEELIKDRGLWKIYLERLKVLPAIHTMEQRGITISHKRTRELKTQYEESSVRCRNICVNVADGEIEELPLNGVSNALKRIVFEKFKLESSKTTKKGNVSMDKYVLDEWLATLPLKSRPYIFVKNLKAYRKRMTALGFIKSYEKFWLPLDGQPDFCRLYPSLNPTGTSTLRCSSSNPNGQQISTQEIAEVEDERGESARYMFGPTPDREWWTMDAQNLELRIPAYAANEEEMIDLFERMNDPPYFGSVHLLMFDTIHPDLFAKHGAKVKDRLPQIYKRVKNGDFAVQYGSMEQSGTADRAYGVLGAFRKIKGRFKRIHGPGGLNEQQIAYAEENGHIETLPDKTVDPDRGYPLLCSRSNWGKILPTVPLDYFCQGTACWWMMKAMIRCHAFLEQYNGKRKPEARAYMILQVHDELIFDFPKRYATVGGKPVYGNVPTARRLQKIMEEGGNDIGLPTPVSVQYHPITWGEGINV